MASFRLSVLAVVLFTALTLTANAVNVSHEERVVRIHGPGKLNVSYDERAVKIDGERKIILSGSIHYPRSTPQMWPSLIKKSKEGGLNTIETYVFWNAHEPLYRQYDFSGNKDLVKFLKMIQEEGLYAILRIGPYVCAEWNYGGFPAWLNSIPDITFRTKNNPFLIEMKTFTTMIVKKMSRERLFASQGGPIILSQIENEYGNVISSYGAEGKAYIHWCADLAESLDIGIPWIMCQEDDAPETMINACNGFYCDKFSPHENKPKMWTENWSGWYKGWGQKIPHRAAEDLAFAVGRFFQYGGTLQNYYMYHGGTNFGRTAGGPYITTSYDYDAPLDEYGNLNQPKWGHLKKLHELIMSMEKVLVYGEVKRVDYFRMVSSAEYSYNGTRACFLGNGNDKEDIILIFEGRQYNLPAWSVSILPDCVNEVYNTARVSTQTSSMVKKLPSEAAEKLHYNLEWTWRAEKFEHLKTPIEKSGPLKGVTYANQLLDQKIATNDTSDYLWYMTSVDVDEDDPIWGEQISLQVNCDCHVLHAIFNGKHIGTKWATNGKYSFVFEADAKLKRGTNSISLLSVTVGLQNYGAHFDKVKNGILGSVKLVAANSAVKDITSNKWAYKVGLNGLERGLEKDDPKNKRKWHPNVPSNRNFVWYKTSFKTPKGTDPVVLDLWGLGKGTAWVNGNDIGRYWPSFLAGESGCSESCDYRGTYHGSECMTNCGNSSQRWYHVPRSFLKEEDNTLVLFEEFGGNPAPVSVQTVTVGKVSANAYEGDSVELSCHGGRPISKINFASFAHPDATLNCQSPNSLSVVEKACLGKESCKIDVSANNFGLTGCASAQKSRLAPAQVSAQKSRLKLAVEVEC